MVGFAIMDPSDRLVHHELRYTISHTGTGARTGMGGSEIRPITVPSGARLHAWVHWTTRMLSLPVEEQRQIVQGTSWGIPGAATFNGRYDGTTSSARAVYAAGPLAAQAEEIRR